MAEDKAPSGAETEAGEKTTPSQKAAAPPAPKFRYQDIPDLGETFADSLGQFIFDGQTLRIEFTVSRLDNTRPGEQRSGRKVPTSRMVLSLGCAVELIQNCRQLTARLEQAAGALQQAAGEKAAGQS